MLVSHQLHSQTLASCGMTSIFKQFLPEPHQLFSLVQQQRFSKITHTHTLHPFDPILRRANMVWSLPSHLVSNWGPLSLFTLPCSGVLQPTPSLQESCFMAGITSWCLYQHVLMGSHQIAIWCFQLSTVWRKSLVSVAYVCKCFCSDNLLFVARVLPCFLTFHKRKKPNVASVEMMVT